MTSSSADPAREADADRLSAQSLAHGDATGWFERLYAEAEAGTAQVPWDVGAPTPLLVSWPVPAGDGRRALVVGAGLGRDAEFVAAQGWTTIAFDISETAVRMARDRFPGSAVTYVVADLFDPPATWRHGFDLVVESNTVQALPRDLRTRATAAVADLVAPGGTLLVLAAAIAVASEHGPPWPLTRDELDAFATSGLSAGPVEQHPSTGDPLALRWRALFHRPA